MAYPTSLDSYSTKVNGQTIDASDVNNPQTAIVSLETKVGIDNSADTTTLDYLIKNAASNGGGHVQTANKGGTGQTSYAKGDLLIGQSSSVLGKLAISPTDGYALVADSTQTQGVKWGVPNSNPTIRFYNTSSVLTWVKPSVLSYIVVEAVGGGGGGGPAAGGAGGAATNGGNTYFGSVLTAIGGTGAGAGGTGGTGGSINMDGEAGQGGVNYGSGNPARGGDGGRSGIGWLSGTGGVGEGSSANNTSGAGGGGGEYRKAVYVSSVLGANVAVGVGAAGSGSTGAVAGTAGAIVIYEY